MMMVEDRPPLRGELRLDIDQERIANSDCNVVLTLLKCECCPANDNNKDYIWLIWLWFLPLFA